MRRITTPERTTPGPRSSNPPLAAGNAELAGIQSQANMRVMFDPDGHPFSVWRDID
jgi:hypothetical protein